MGVNNRARRAAKKRRRQERGTADGAGRRDGFGRDGFGRDGFGRDGFGREGGSGSHGAGHGGYGRQRTAPGGPSPGGPSPGGPPPGDGDAAATMVWTALRETGDDAKAATGWARVLTAPQGPVRPDQAVAALQHVLTTLLGAVVRGGWSPADLGEITTRRLGAGHLPLVASLLEHETARHPRDRVAAGWRAQLAALDSTSAPPLRTIAGFGQGLTLAALFLTLPVIPTLVPRPGASPEGNVAGNPSDARLLARVRALLAKAESTQYQEEAEALSAKAQELISRHSLDRLVVESAAEGSGEAVVARRVWIDRPYVMAKAMLVDAVARANRCRSVVSEALGFTTLVGVTRDLDAVELLATSLLVQADVAMLRHGRQMDRSGMSRTASFRRSFLLSYATRIGERLYAATSEVTQAGAGELVPLVRHHEERVEAATEELFPDVVSRAATISNRQGWAAGRAAADIARLDANPSLTEAAG